MKISLYGVEQCRPVHQRVPTGARPVQRRLIRTLATTPKTIEYNDSITDLLFIGLCRIAFGNKAQWQSPQPFTTSESYQGMVDVSRALQRGKTAAQQQQAVIEGFPTIPDWFRKLFPYTVKGAEINAAITPLFFTWLVGPCSVTSIDDVLGAHGPVKSGVKIEKCRYLTESSCASMCVNLCKAPTQTFFTHSLGVPLTMEPNFEDYSCLMKFGVSPSSPEEDPAYLQPCLMNCPVAGATKGQERDQTCSQLSP